TCPAAAGRAAHPGDLGARESCGVARGECPASGSVGCHVLKSMKSQGRPPLLLDAAPHRSFYFSSSLGKMPERLLPRISPFIATRREISGPRGLREANVGVGPPH